MSFQSLLDTGGKDNLIDGKTAAPTAAQHSVMPAWHARPRAIC